jgi:hypothetical protein
MKRSSVRQDNREYDFALIVAGVSDLTDEVEDALFESGCDDATLSIQHGRLYVEFSRRARSLKDAIVSAIRDVRAAGIAAEVLRVDECNLVTPSEIARRIGKSRQLVFQYIAGQRGPGRFPAPDCHLAEGAPLWTWCAVSSWLAEHEMIDAESRWNAEVVAAINTWLESARQRQQNPKLLDEIGRELQRL